MENIVIKQHTKKEKSTTQKYICIGIAIVAFLLAAFFPLPDSVLTADDVALTHSGRISLAVLIFCLVLWVTEPIPFHITGVLGVVLLTFSKALNSSGRIISFNEIIRSGFGDSTVVFFIGILVLAVAITKSGLGARIAMYILTITGNKTSNVLLGFMLGGAGISFFITDMAVAAILTPIALSLCKQEGLVPLKSNFAKALLITCAWAATIGGNALPSGGGANIYAFNYIRSDAFGYPLAFLEWCLYGIPITILMTIPGWFILKTMFKPEIKYLAKTKEQMKADFKAMGPMSKDERSTAIIFIFTIILWFSSDFVSSWIGVTIGPALPAFFACAFFFLPGVTSFKWKDISKDVSWESVLLIA
ncbi:MAG: SLC13 family permease, partial [Clostridia bacterium]|nr:SLC13 family permease [Clostridia bacterium]